MKRVALIVVMTLFGLTSFADDDGPIGGCGCNEGYELKSGCTEVMACEDPTECCEKVNEVPIVSWQLFFLAGAGMVMGAFYWYKRAEVVETSA